LEKKTPGVVLCARAVVARERERVSLKHQFGLKDFEKFASGDDLG
jgi:hypothetical protein